MNITIIHNFNYIPSIKFMMVALVAIKMVTTVIFYKLSDECTMSQIKSSILWMSPKLFSSLSPDLVLKLMMTEDSPNSDGGAKLVTLYGVATSSSVSSMTSSQASSFSVCRAPHIICSSSVTCNNHIIHTMLAAPSYTTLK